MCDEKSKSGRVEWVDLTVDDAESIRDFYGQVVGWNAASQEMGGYQDFNMLPSGSDVPIAGICHARGTNAGVPPQWMIYINVDDVVRSATTCEALGGEVIDGPRACGDKQCCIIRDPAGAVCALYG